jgi:hypothetical protein
MQFVSDQGTKLADRSFAQMLGCEIADTRNSLFADRKAHPSRAWNSDDANGLMSLNLARLMGKRGGYAKLAGKRNSARSASQGSRRRDRLNSRTKEPACAGL